MLFRGGMDAVMMRLQLAVPENTFLDAQHYNEVFTTHRGSHDSCSWRCLHHILLFNFLVPLQIGARDVAFPRLKAT